jgi:hypothetical protein
MLFVAVWSMPAVARDAHPSFLGFSDWIGAMQWRSFLCENGE